LLCALVLVVSAACRDGTAAPLELADGSRPPALKLRLEDEPRSLILTQLWLVDPARVQPRTPAADCLRGPARDARPTGPIVVRSSVYATSVTFRSESALHGCDDSTGLREGDRRWCGSSFGNLFEDRLRDSRLDMAGCSTVGGQRIATAWVEPLADTRFLVIEQKGFGEVYETAGGVAVRVATIGGFHDDPLGVTFHVSEHRADGRLLRRYELDALPAG
jgi:hypothetical protein